MTHKPLLRKKGRPRNPTIDTGHPGVVLSRRSEPNQRQVAILVLQNLLDPQTKRFIPTYPPVWAIGRRGYDADPGLAQSHFESHIQEAIALRHYHNHLHDIGQPPSSELAFEDVPGEFRNRQYDTPPLDLSAIFESCEEFLQQKPPKTSYSSPDALEKALLDRDLTKPGPVIWLNGFQLAFKRYELGGATLYLPRMIYRARHEWRLRVLCRGGPWLMSIPDKTDQASPLETLPEAWQALIQHLSRLQADPTRRIYTGEPLLWTGVEHLAFNIIRQPSNPGGPTRTKFQLRYLYRTPKGISRRVSLGYWNYETLNDRSLTKALMKGAALSRFYKSLGDGAPEKIDAAMAIPKDFWPESPVVSIAADDLLYYVERLESGLTLRTRS